MTHEVTKTGERGDLVCPGCGANIMFPIECEIVPGNASCPLCGADFSVGQSVADEANEKAQASEPRGGVPPQPQPQDGGAEALGSSPEPDEPGARRRCGEGESQ